MSSIKIILSGAAIGIANILPGVSGGTIAVIFNVYDPIIAAINGIFSKTSKRLPHIKFLGKLLIGTIVSIVLCANLLHRLIQNYPHWIFAFILGLIVASIPGIYQTHISTKPTIRHLLLLLVGAGSIIWISLQDQSLISLSSNQLQMKDFVYLTFSGFIAAGTMIIPGISGSLILLILGTYIPILKAVSDMNISILFCVAIGAAIGLLSISKLMGYFLKKYPTATYFLIIGLLLGSLVKVAIEANFFSSTAIALPGALCLIAGIILEKTIEKLV